MLLLVADCAIGKEMVTETTKEAKTTTRTRIHWGSGRTHLVLPSRASAAPSVYLILVDSPYSAFSLEVSCFIMKLETNFEFKFHLSRNFAYTIALTGKMFHNK